MDQIGNRNISFAIEDKCFQLSVNDGKVVCKEITKLKSNQEEADTKFGETTIIIKSPDNDVAILVCHFSRDISARILIMKKEKMRNIYLKTSGIADAAGMPYQDCMLSIAATQLPRLQVKGRRLL